MMLKSQKRTVGSGSAKLAANKAASARSSGRDTSTADETPDEYNAKVKATKAVSATETKTTSSISAASKESVPSPVNPAFAQEYMKQQQVKNQTAIISPHSLGSDVTAPTSITSTPNTNVRQVSENVILPTEKATLMQDVKTGINQIVTGGQDKAKNVTISNTSQSIMDAGTQVTDKTTDYKEFASIVYPNDPIQGYAGPRIIQAGANVVSMFSRVPAGAEVAAQKPSLLPYAVGLAALGTVDYAVETAKNDPGQLVADVAVFSALGYSAGKIGGAIKSNVPAISTGKQGFLLKVKVPESTTVDPVIKPTIQAEFKGSGMGFDGFDIQKINTEIIPFKATTAGKEVLIGDTTKGLTDIYIRTNEAQARALSNQYTGNVRNIKTPEGSFVEFEPTGKIEYPIYQRTGSRISTSTPEMIGEIPKVNLKINNPFRFEKRVNLQKGELQISNSNTLQLPETTTTINIKGKVVKDFDIRKFYKEPVFQEPRQLNTGTITLKEPLPRGSLLSSETAELMPRSKYRTQLKPTEIGEMPQMNIRSVKVERPLVSFKESSNKIDISDMQKLFDDAVKRGSDPIQPPSPLKKVSLNRYSKPGKGFMPVLAGLPDSSTVPQTKDVTLPDMITGVSPFPVIDPDPFPSPDPYHSSRRSRTPTPATSETIPDINIRTLIKLPEIKPVKYRKPKDKNVQQKSKKRKSTSWDYDRLLNDWQDPTKYEVKF